MTHEIKSTMTRIECVRANNANMRATMHTRDDVVSYIERIARRHYDVCDVYLSRDRVDVECNERVVASYRIVRDVDVCVRVTS